MKGINKAACGPDIPGLFFVGNSSDAVDESEAIDKYNRNLPKIPRDGFRAVPNRPFGFAVYCEAQYTVYAEAWVTGVGLMLEALTRAWEHGEASGFRDSTD
jgi:hypothetical protein